MQIEMVVTFELGQFKLTATAKEYSEENFKETMNRLVDITRGFFADSGYWKIYGCASNEAIMLKREEG